MIGSSRRTGFALALLIACAAGCDSMEPFFPPVRAYQYSTIDALLDGNYDDGMSFVDLADYGDFGLGTFDALDGEMVALGGHFIQVRSNGQARAVPRDAHTPFSIVTHFPSGASQPLHGPIDYRQLQNRIDSMRACKNADDGHAFAIRVRGRFDHVRVRSVPRQDPPYARLAEVVKHQSVFELNDVKGTLVGFWFPENLRHINVPGYHFHFITDDRRAGGHVLDLTLADATAELQELREIVIMLPSKAPTTQPSTDGGRKLEAVEK